MGTVYAEITLKNIFDEEKYAEELISEHEIRYNVMRSYGYPRR